MHRVCVWQVWFVPRGVCFIARLHASVTPHRPRGHWAASAPNVTVRQCVVRQNRWLLWSGLFCWFLKERCFYFLKEYHHLPLVSLRPVWWFVTRWWGEPTVTFHLSAAQLWSVRLSFLSLFYICVQGKPISYLAETKDLTCPDGFFAAINWERSNASCSFFLIHHGAHKR